jgi:phosphate transport system substrate-binding protein
MHSSPSIRRYSSLAATGLLILMGVALAAQTIKINGAGATFPYPIYSKWFSEYNKLKPNVEINYQSIGSGGGIRQITNQTVFFGATDGPMTQEQLLAGASCTCQRCSAQTSPCTTSLVSTRA